MTLFEAISPTARELLVLHCLPSRPRHFFVVGECHHCGVSKADFLKASRAATNASRRVLRQAQVAQVAQVDPLALRAEVPRSARNTTAKLRDAGESGVEQH